jgi:hypothetical protein
MTTLERCGRRKRSDDGGNNYLRNVVLHQRDYTVLYLRRLSSHTHHRDNLKSHNISVVGMAPLFRLQINNLLQYYNFFADIRSSTKAFTFHFERPGVIHSVNIQTSAL